MLKLCHGKVTIVRKHIANYANACFQMSYLISRRDVILKPEADQFSRTTIKMQHGDLFKAAPHGCLARGTTLVVCIPFHCNRSLHTLGLVMV